ncbi:GMP/IMP nucleotidase [Hydrogenovibrio marinus]|uniref:HAD family hydrolase n=1 Tax=Hydrogenovibrio marinus TaxID=28885 RepID=A0A066ZT62_HYDMR|nr:GMP/IMP nucleotidase [Hydrogenovibrio marinus]KDN96662.1 HAD family hydrolase [Hydrogenovibrio marinus]BBN58898.1 hydrolase [Hydrogenovibrio marinus]
MTNINWQTIDTVLLDMDGTLLDLHFDWHFWMTYLPEIYANENNLTIDEANRIIHEKIHSQTGTLNWYCLDYWSTELQLPVAELKRDLKHMIQAHPEVMTFLKRLKELGKTVIMVTNAHRDSLAIKLEMTEIGDYFDAMVSAHDYGMPKENADIWRKIQSDFPFNPQRTLLIDDNIHALQTAQDFGIRYCVAATHVSPNMDKVDPKGFSHFENFNEIMP